MPYAIRHNSKGWGVQNTETGEWHSRDTSRTKAKKQLRLLNAIEHGYKTTGKGNRR